MTHRLRILHLSDLHERVTLPWMDEERQAKVRLRAGSRQRVLEDNFLESLEEVRGTTPIDIVCFTGDVADWGLPEEYAKAEARIHQILQAVEVPCERLFLVPGNHDVQRREVARDWKKEMRKLAQANPQGLSDWMGGMPPPYGVSPRWREEIEKRTLAFWEWVDRDLGRGILRPSSGPHGRLGYRVPLLGFGLPFSAHIIGLDSAWLCGDDRDTCQICLTEGQVDRLTRDDDGQVLPGFRLALVHHPLSHLADGDRCRRLLADTVDLLLHGHQHDPIAETHDDPDRSLRMIAAGSLYEGDEGDHWVNSFHLIEAELDSSGRPLCYEVEFWGWSDRGHWYRTGALYKKARDGRLTWWTPLGETQRPREASPPFGAHVRARDLFIGREDELGALADLLLAGEAPSTVAITAIEGMPGVGKSYLAARFAHVYQDAFPGGIHWLAFDPEAPRDAEQFCEELCDRLHLRSPNAGDRWKAVGEVLRLRPSLVIVENVDGEREAQEAACFVERLPGCRVLVTGRFRHLGESQGWHAVPVNPFNPEDAFQQLVAEHRSPTDDREADEFRSLVVSLGCLPLAIHLAAGHLGLEGRTCSGFLQMLHQRGLRVGPADPADRLTREGARAVLSSSFEISLEDLREMLGDEAGPCLAGFYALGHSPLCGFGRSLGAAIGD
jgi:calcineurin-like phosphoesterase family protein